MEGTNEGEHSAQLQPGINRDRSPRARWGNHGDLFTDGFMVVPNKFFRAYANLRPPLTQGEVLFILQLMTFKWDEAEPYPSYRTLATLMGVKEKTVQRYAQSLCRKKYLYRRFQPKATNRFDLTNLLRALANAPSIPVKMGLGEIASSEANELE
jgi:hypothetical protein